MRVIYVDTLFFLNMTIDYLLLLASARLAGEELRRARFLCGAVLGGLYAVAMFLPGMSFLYHPLCRGAVAVLMVLIAFSKSRRLLRQVLIFFMLACAFGGGVLGASMLGGRQLALDGGVFYSDMDIKIVLVSAAACYCALTLVFRRWAQHSVTRGELEPVFIKIDDKEICLTGLVDTGNTLSDPISGRPVLVADGMELASVLPAAVKLERETLCHPFDAMERLNHLWPGRFRLIPYKAVGVERGLLLTVRTDVIRIRGREEKGMLVALSPNAVSDGGNYQVLVGAS